MCISAWEREAAILRNEHTVLQRAFSSSLKIIVKAATNNMSHHIFFFFLLDIWEERKALKTVNLKQSMLKSFALYSIY